MTQNHESTDLEQLRQRKRRRAPLRKIAVWLGLVAVCIVMGSGGLWFYLRHRLAQGPIGLDWLLPRLEQSLNERFKSGYLFSAKSAQLLDLSSGIKLEMTGLRVTNSHGDQIVAAPKARITLDFSDLAKGNFIPQDVEVEQIELKLSIAENGALAIAAGDAGAPDVALSDLWHSSQDNPEPIAQRQSLAMALRQALDQICSEDSPFQAIDHLALTNSRLKLSDNSKGEIIQFNGVAIRFDRIDSHIGVELTAEGQRGRWSVRASTDISQSDERRVHLGIDRLSFDEIVLAAGVRSPGFVLDAPIFFNGELSLSRQGMLTSAQGELLLQAGLFHVDNRDHEPLLFDKLSIATHLEVEQKQLKFDNIEFLAGDMHMAASGSIDLPNFNSVSVDSQQTVHGFNFALRPNSAFGTERPGDKSIVFDSASVAGTLNLQKKAIYVDQLDVKGPGLDFQLSGDFEMQPPHIAITLKGHDMDLTYVPRLMPSTVAAPVRGWMIDHIRSGHLIEFSGSTDFDEAALKAIDIDGPLEPDAQSFTGSVDDTRIFIKDGMPDIIGLDASGVATGREVHMNVTHGLLGDNVSRRLVMSEAHYDMPDISLKPPPANMVSRLVGSLDSATHILSLDALKPYANLPLDPQAIRGQIDGHLWIDLLVTPKEDPTSVKTRVSGTISSFSADHIIGKEKLENATLTLTADKSGMHTIGTGKIFGSNATVELNKPGNEPAEALIVTSIDDAARAHLGIGFAGISGPIGVKIKGSPNQNANVKSTGVIDLDLTKTVFDNPVPGLVKAAGKPGKADLQVTGDAQGTTIEDMQIDIGASSIKGSAVLGADGMLTSAKLSQVHISGGDDIGGEVQRTSDGYKINLHGNVIDARPSIASLTNPSPNKDSKDSDLDLTVVARRILGHNREVIDNGQIKFFRHGSVLQNLKLTGSFSGKSVVAETLRPGLLKLMTENAGAFFAFTNLYRHMQGGTMAMTAEVRNGKADGELTVHDFALLDEPAIRNIVEEGVPQHPGDTNYRPNGFDPNAVPFDKLAANFRRAGGRLDVQDGILYGPQIGTSLDGMIDFAGERIDVKGTFVPAFGLNNFFARIPVLGTVLAGDSREGLFAINYRISGPMSAPVLSVNPLSAIAPGFLRKIFGAGELPSELKTPGQ